MKWDVLYNFISPVTGYVLCDPGYVLMGNEKGIAVPSPFLQDIGDATYVLNTPNENLPNAQALIDLDNLPGILKSDDKGIISIAVPGDDYASESEITAINNILTPLNTIVGILTVITIPFIEGEIISISGRVTLLEGEIVALTSSVEHIKHVKYIIQTPDDTVPDAQVLSALNPGLLQITDDTGIISTIAFPEGNLTLEGFVMGGPPDDKDVLTTYRGPTCLLTNIPAGGDVSMDNYRVTDLHQSPEGDFDAVSTKFLWDLLSGQVDILWL